MGARLMALTMTRTRTQTTLTKLAMRVAEVHGELEYLEEVLAKEMPAEKRALLEARRLSVMGHRDALYLTIRQFDPRIDPAEIGVLGRSQRKSEAKRLRLNQG